MKGEFLSIETAGKIARLERENKELSKQHLATINKLIETQGRIDYEDYKTRNEKAIKLLDELLKEAYIDGKYILYDYSTSDLLEIKEKLQRKSDE